MSTFGRVFRVTTFGESHCLGVGCVIDGCPPGLLLSENDIQPALTRRRPGQSRLSTPRDEQDKVQIQSGTEKGRTLGTPISLFVPNLNIKPEDYSEMSNVPRPGHADATYQYKYGLRASSGGGRASARETIGRVASGAVAEKFLNTTYGTEIVSFVSSVGDIELPMEERIKPYTRDDVEKLGTIIVIRGQAKPSLNGTNNEWKKLPVTATKGQQAELDGKDESIFCLMLKENEHVPAYMREDKVYSREGVHLSQYKPSDFIGCEELVSVRTPHTPTACRIATLIRQVKNEQDSIGGTVMCVCRNVPVGLGEPCFDKLEAMLAHGMMSLPATKAFEIGLGFAACRLRGSQHNDPFEKSSSTTPGVLNPKTNNAGGTLGGISSGAPIIMRIAVKPVSTIGQAQHTSNYDGNETILEAKGRHDPCVLPRTPPLIEAMAALVLADAALLQRTRLGGSNTMPECITLVAKPREVVVENSSNSNNTVNGNEDTKRVKLG
jgi:chorismate synthase